MTKPKDFMDPSQTLEKIDPDYFTADYKEACFLIWYKNGRPSLRKLSKILPVSSVGRPASEWALRTWYKSEEWKKRADGMDAEVSREINKEAIEEKILMLKRHADAAGSLVKMGIDYLKSHDLDKSADAIRAVAVGMEQERAARGMPIALNEMEKWTTEQLVGFVEKQLSNETPLLPDESEEGLDEKSNDSDPTDDPDIIEGEVTTDEAET
jgi:hypothetical protein